MRGRLASVLALLALLPCAAALDTLPSEDRAGPTDARFLLRLRGDAPLRVEADGPVRVALARHGEAPEPFVDAPADLAALPGASWHGLGGVVELVAERDDPARALVITAWQGEGGVAVEWAAMKKPTPGAAPILLATASLAACILLPRR